MHPLNIWGKTSPKSVAWLPVYQKKIDPKQDEGGIFDFRSRLTFNSANYPAQKAEELHAQDTSGNTAKETAAQAQANFSRTYSGPKRGKPKNWLRKTQSIARRSCTRLDWCRRGDSNP